MATLQEWIDCQTADGKPLPREKCDKYRERHPELSWDVSQPSRGLGDTIAKITHATGIDRVVKAVAWKECGCAKRQAALNQMLPYKE